MKSKDQQLLEEAYGRVIESLSSPFEYVRNKSIEDDDEEVYEFYPDPEDSYRPSEEQQGSHYKVLLAYDEDPYPGVTITFTYHRPGDAKGTHAMTNTGDAFRVMATVKEIVLEYINRHWGKLDKITFSGKADERGRVTLYKRLAQMLTDYLGNDWELSNSTSEQGGVSGEVFTIEKQYR